jgi:hypothetical protein
MGALFKYALPPGVVPGSLFAVFMQILEASVEAIKQNPPSTNTRHMKMTRIVD